MNVYREPDDGRRCEHCGGIMHGIIAGLGALDLSWRTGDCHPQCVDARADELEQRVAAERRGQRREKGE